MKRSPIPPLSLLPLLLILLLAACRPAETPSVEATTAAAPFPNGEVIDLSYAFDAETIYWPTAEGFVLTEDTKGIQEGGYYYEANSFSAAEHGGTHLDAPIHFFEDRWTADAIPLERLMGPAIVVDVAEKAVGNPDYQGSVADFEGWESEHGAMPDGVIVLVRTGYGQFGPDRERYMGTGERGPDAVAKLHFPGLHPDAARWLVENRSIHAFGLDTPSIDYGQSSLFETHQVLFEANIPAFENVAYLDRLPPDGFTVIALPMKIKDGSGGPLRIVAIVEDK